MIGLSIELFPIVYRWIYDRVEANIVYIDEKKSDCLAEEAFPQ